MSRSIDSEPIAHVEWIEPSALRANAFNPGYVPSTELRVLAQAIADMGWTAPILVSLDLEIIDGFHRWMLAQESALVQQRGGGKVPIVRLDLPPDKARITTIRMGRARGVQSAVRMSALVRELIDTYGWERDDLARQLGMTGAEVDLLYKDLFEHRDLKNYKYSSAWVPETFDVEIDESSGDWVELTHEEFEE